MSALGPAAEDAEHAVAEGARAVREARYVERPEQLEALSRELEGSEAIALDVEANGMFVYRARLCTIQLAFRGAGGLEVAIVDTLRLDPAPLAPVFAGARGRVILHDLSFDARICAEHGLRLAAASDTSVLARFVGHEATGLASVARSILGLTLHKGLQQHDWAARPLGRRELDYLASDVAYLLPIFDALAERARALDVWPEAEEESAYRLRAALAPPVTRPAWARIKGALQLGAPSRAILRRLALAREALAAEADRPPHRVLSNDRLLELARRAPSSAGDVARLTAGSGALSAWVSAIEAGRRDGDVPEEERVALEPRREPPEVVARRRRAEGLVSAWRARVAAERAIDAQAVLPGHCASALAEVLRAAPPRSERPAAIAAIEGLGARRVERYMEAWLGLFDALDADAG